VRNYANVQPKEFTPKPESIVEDFNLFLPLYIRENKGKDKDKQACSTEYRKQLFAIAKKTHINEPFNILMADISPDINGVNS
jgi:hypothetical protein